MEYTQEMIAELIEVSHFLNTCADKSLSPHVLTSNESHPYVAVVPIK